MKPSDEEEEEEEDEDKVASNNKEDNLKANKTMYEVQNLVGCFAGPGNCRQRFLPMLYWNKELKMLPRLLKRFGMVNVKAVIDANPCD